MFLYDRYRPMPRTQSGLLIQIGCFALKFKYLPLDPLYRLPLLSKNEIFVDCRECWNYTHSGDSENPFEFRTTSLDHNSEVDYQWMSLVEWLVEIETTLAIKPEHLNVVYHMCVRLMNKLKSIQI